MIDRNRFPDAKQQALLLICLGVKGTRIFLTLQDSRSDLEEAIIALMACFEPWVNVVTERSKFRCQRQRDGENIDSFVSNLWQLAVTCEYDPLSGGLICDQIAEETNSNNLHERLLMETDLTLEKAIVIAWQFEQAVVNARLLSGDRMND